MASHGTTNAASEWPALGSRALSLVCASPVECTCTRAKRRRQLSHGAYGLPEKCEFLRFKSVRTMGLSGSVESSGPVQTLWAAPAFQGPWLEALVQPEDTTCPHSQALTSPILGHMPLRTLWWYMFRARACPPVFPVFAMGTGTSR